VITYRHGGDVVNFAKDIEVGVDEVIDLSSNINFIKPNIDLNLNRVATSSYPNYELLYRRVAQKYSVDIDSLELFNGATVAITSLLKYLRIKKDKIVIYSPAYLEYKRVAEILNYKIFLINRFENKLSPPKYSVVVFVNPSTPDGKLYDIKPFIKLWKSLKCTIVIDESFLDFVKAPSATNYLNYYENLFIIKSMTKFYSSAGVRVGGVISNSCNIEEIKSLEPLWKISAFDTAYIISALKDDTLFTRTDIANKISKKYLLKSLENSHFALSKNLFQVKQTLYCLNQTLKLMSFKRY